MATNNAVNVGLAGATGTVSFVGSTSPTLVTPNLGVATATSVVFSPSTNGIIGTATNDNAASGFVGEYISASVLIGSAVSLTSSTVTNITSIALSAGDWQVSGTVLFTGATGTLITTIFSGISNSSGTFGVNGSENNIAGFQAIPLSASASANIPVGPMRFALASPTTIYLLGQAFFSVSTCSAYGFIGARRIR